MRRLDTKKVIISIVGALLVVVAAQGAAMLILNLLMLIKIPRAICNIIGGCLYIGLSYFLLMVLVIKYLHSDLEEVSIPRLKINVKWIIVAVVLPIMVTGAFLCLPGELQKSDMALEEVINTITFGLFFSGLGAGIVEEMVFRGVILNVLDKKCGRAVAIVVPSLIFGFVHIIGMGFNLLSNIQVLVAGTLVGIMFSLISLQKHSIWNSAIVHAVWNIVIIGGVLTVGETMGKHSIYSYILRSKSFALTGGEFGIESSIFAVVAYLVVIGIAFKGISRKIR